MCLGADEWEYILIALLDQRELDEVGVGQEVYEENPKRASVRVTWWSSKGSWSQTFKAMQLQVTKVQPMPDHHNLRPRRTAPPSILYASYLASSSPVRYASRPRSTLA